MQVVVTGTNFAMNIMYILQKHKPDKDISFLKQFSLFIDLEIPLESDQF